MTHPRPLPPIVRNLGALAAAFLASAAANIVLGRTGLAVARSSTDPLAVGAAFVVVMFFAVPAVAGLVLGLFSTRPVLLAIPAVLLSLSMTFLTLGAAGMPHGWKVMEYVIQTALIAAVAALVAARRRRAATPSSEQLGR